MPWLSAPVSSRLRLRRIAPDTHHQDQASGNNNRCLSPWWLRHPRRTLVPQCVQWVAQICGLPTCRRQSMAGSHCRRSALTACRGRRHDIPFKFPELEPSLPTGLAGRRRELHAKQRVISKGLRSFRMWKHARASLCARALRARIGFCRGQTEGIVFEHQTRAHE